MKAPRLFQVFLKTYGLLFAAGGLLLTAHSSPGADSPSPVPVPPGPLDLQTCYELAILRSETLGLKEEDIRIAQARYWQAVGAILPQVHEVTTERVQNTSSFSSSASGGTTGGTSVGTGSFVPSKDSFVTAISVRQPIFSGFRDQALSAANKAEIEARKQDRRRARQQLYLDVSDLFYQILMYQDDLRLFTESKSDYEKRVAEVERRVHLGRSRQGDLLSSRSQLAQILVSIENSKGLLAASADALNFLTGLAGSKWELKDSHALPKADDLEAYLTETRERPDILAAIQEEKAAVKNLSAAKGEHWPTISAEGDYYLKQHPESPREWDISLTCDIPLFEGGAIEARVSERKALVRQSQISLEQLRRAADKDVRVAYDNFLSTAAQVARLQELGTVADENYKVQSEDDQRGVASNLDVLDALAQVHDTRRRLSEAEWGARANLIRLHVSAGAMENRH